MYNDRGKSLYFILKNLMDKLASAAICAELLCEYEELCNQYNSAWEMPELKIRYAQYFWGKYYMKCHDYIRAENAFIQALRADMPRGLSPLVTDACIKTQLLIIYLIFDNFDLLKPILKELMDLVTDRKHSGELSEKDFYIICGIYNEYFGCFDIGIDDDKYLKELRRDILSISQRIKLDISAFSEVKKEWVGFICISVLLLTEQNIPSEMEYTTYLNMLTQIKDYFELEEGQEHLIYRTLIRIAWKAGVSEGSYVDECVNAVEKSSIDTAKAEIFQAAASFYYGTGQCSKGLSCLQQALEKLTEEWHYHIRHFDKRAYRFLLSSQDNFLGCYDTIHKYMDSKFAYEKVLQFKALSSLAVRERNRFFYQNGVDPQLLNDIKKLQDAYARCESERIWGKRSEGGEDIENELRDLEATFADQFPQGISFADITLEKVLAAIPDNSVVIEYMYYIKDYEIHEFTPDSDKDKTAIDIYVTHKVRNNCTLKRFTVSEGAQILAKAKEYVAALSGTVKIPGARRDHLRSELYRKLLKPLVPYLDGVEQLYIAPDRDLFNLPFEILYDEKPNCLEGKYTVTQIECARDFLFQCNNCLSSTGSLIIGNPQFTVYDSIRNKEDSKPLPFSKVEAHMVSQYFDGRYFSGKAATKDVLLAAAGYRNIHIATHGSNGNNDKFETPYSSVLEFAGINDWRNSGKASEIYGNGMVTADEISRLDLRSVELVVLSTCWSGMNRVIEDKGFYGMLDAFFAAGVHYVIAHLWPVNDDLGTIALMDHFYYQYTVMHQSPPSALNLAKQYLQRVTVGELRQKGFFDFALQTGIGEAGAKMIEQYKMDSDKMQPFADENYRSGFACYKCN